MIEELRIVEAYESMYSGDCERVDEGDPGSKFSKGANLAGKLVGKTMSTAQKIGAKSPAVLKKFAQGTAKVATDAGKKTVKGAKVAYAAVKDKGVSGAIKSGVKSTAKAGINKAGRVVGKYAGRFSRKHPVISWILRTSWKGAKFLTAVTMGLVTGVFKKAAEVLRVGEEIATGFGGKRMTSFLGEAEGEGGGEDAELNRYADFAKNSLSQEERDAVLQLFVETKRAEGEDVDLSEMDDESKYSIIGAVIMSCTKGIQSGDDEATVQKKIEANIEGQPTDGIVNAAKPDADKDGQTADGAEGGGDGDGGTEEEGGEAQELSADDLKQLRLMFKAAGL